jgi:hypothetical protein
MPGKTVGDKVARLERITAAFEASLTKQSELLQRVENDLRRELNRAEAATSDVAMRLQGLEREAALLARVS